MDGRAPRTVRPAPHRDRRDGGGHPRPRRRPQLAKVIDRHEQSEPEPRDGKVTVRVTGAAVRNLTLRGRRAQCPGTLGAVVGDVPIPRMALSRAGVARGRFVHPDSGPVRVKVTVGAQGTATGQPRFPANRNTTAPFTAKKR